MVAALSEGRPKYEAHAATHAHAAAEGAHLTKRLLVLADEDAAAYAAFAAAMKLPRETDAEREARADAIKAAARLAADVPLATMEACRDVAAAAEVLAGRSNVNAASDLEVAVLLAEAAARGAEANVIINLPSLGDEAVAKEMRGSVEALRNEVSALARQVHDVVASGVMRDAIAGAT
jgi:formiminotetrahydrofolate cyclodeaminase